jgi:hypothetical protein
MCYTRFGAYPNHAHNINCKKELLKKERKTKEKHNSTDKD